MFLWRNKKNVSTIDMMEQNEQHLIIEMKMEQKKQHLDECVLYSSLWLNYRNEGGTKWATSGQTSPLFFTLVSWMSWVSVEEEGGEEGRERKREAT